MEVEFATIPASRAAKRACDEIFPLNMRDTMMKLGEPRTMALQQSRHRITLFVPISVIVDCVIINVARVEGANWNGRSKRQASPSAWIASVAAPKRVACQSALFLRMGDERTPEQLGFVVRH